MPTPFQLLHGADAPPSRGLRLRAGPVTALFEPEIGFLRYVRYAGCEVLRGIYGAVRDAAWGTVPARIEKLEVDQGADAFTVRFRANCHAGDVRFEWAGAITGTPTGVTYSFDGLAASDFQTSRTGLCALHPVPEGVPVACVVEHVDGREEHGEFPIEVEPHQPFREIRALRQEVAPGVLARIEFTGDTFEMEDQRNWTDASFKTYSRPLELPRPYLLSRGDRVRQAVAVTFAGDSGKGIAEPDEITLSVTSQVAGRLPQIGLGTAHHGLPLSRRETERLRLLCPAHLRVDLHLAQAGWLTTFQRAAAEAAALGTRLEVALFLAEGAETQLAAFRNALAGIRVPIARWLVFQEGARATPDAALELVRRTLRDAPLFAPAGGGTNNSFADLNRRAPFALAPDFVVFAINPQVHAFDDRTLVENLEGQAQAVRSAVRLATGKPVVVSPVTLRPRFNAEATGPEPSTPPGELPFAVDPRQMSLFGAGWTVGCLHALSRSGASSVTLYETTGWRGVMETEKGSFLPEQFASFPGGVYPLYHPLADLPADRAQVLVTHSSHPLDAEALALRLPDGRLRVLLVNHAEACREVRVTGLPGAVARLRTLDLTNVERAMRAPEAYRTEPAARAPISEGALRLPLEPFAVVTLDAEVGDA